MKGGRGTRRPRPQRSPEPTSPPSWSSRGPSAVRRSRARSVASGSPVLREQLNVHAAVAGGNRHGTAVRELVVMLGTHQPRVRDEPASDGLAVAVHVTALPPRLHEGMVMRSRALGPRHAQFTGVNSRSRCGRNWLLLAVRPPACGRTSTCARPRPSSEPNGHRGLRRPVDVRRLFTARRAPARSTRVGPRAHRPSAARTSAEPPHRRCRQPRRSGPRTRPLPGQRPRPGPGRSRPASGAVRPRAGPTRRAGWSARCGPPRAIGEAGPTATVRWWSPWSGDTSLALRSA